MLFGANGTTYVVGSEGGVTQVTLSAANMPSHRHLVDSHLHTNSNHQHYIMNGNTATSDVTNSSYLSLFRYNTSYENHRLGGTTTVADRGKTNSAGGDNTGSSSPYTNYQGSDTAFNVLNAYRAVNIWRRTA
jgi:microcystin-dependent protein